MRRTLIALLAAGLAMAACGNDDDSDVVGDGGRGANGGSGANGDDVADPPTADGVTTLARVGGHDDALADGLQVVIAVNEPAADDLWDHHVPDDLPDGDGDPDTEGQYGSLSDVDYDTQSVVLLSWGGSGSCPPWVTDITTAQDTLAVDFDRVPAEACTDDFVPFRLLLAVDRAQLPEPDGTPITRIDVPSENLTDVNGDVRFHFDEEVDMDEQADFDRGERTEAAEAVLGLPEDEIDESPTLRVVRRGDEHFNVTMDLRPGRLNVELDDDGSGTYVATRVVVEVPDDEDPLVVE